MTNPIRLIQTFWLEIQRKNLVSAANTVQTLIRSFPTEADSWLTASFFAEHTAQYEKSLHNIEQALLLEPNSYSLHLRHLHCLNRVGSLQKAHIVAEQLIKTSPGDVLLLSELALQCSQLQRYKDATTLYQQALELQPNEPTLYYNFATMLRVTGKLEHAEDLLDKAIQLAPTDTDAWLLRSDLRRQTQCKNHTTGLKKVLQHSSLSPKQRVQLHYALAKELEDLERFAESFVQLQLGASLRRRHINYQLDEDLATFANIREQFSKEFFRQYRNQLSGYQNLEPIFIISMPRAGSTLAERFLGCDPTVQLAGELTNFSDQLSRLSFLHTGKKLTKIELIKTAKNLNFKRLGEAYLESTRPLTGNKTHFIDKLPLNFLYVGLIHLALPKAKIIHITRNPIDHCYAIYKHLFADAYPFSYQLDELIQYYQAYQSLMDHWEECIPGVIHHLSYEDLTHHPRTSSQALYKYCGLDWNEQCLNFHMHNQQSSNTGSSSQIRQALYTDSVARWRCYEEELAELVQAFPATQELKF